MKRPAYGLLVAVAVVMGTVAVVVSRVLDERLLDPDGFLGPGWLRLPAMVLGAFLVDVLPRSMWRAHRNRGGFRSEARALIKEHWTRERIQLVVIGLTSFYVTYVSYRNLKNYLPRFYDTMQDPLLHRLDRWVFFGHEPATVLHAMFGETWAAQFLAFIYLLYLPLAPISLVVWLVWSRNLSYGYWYATANCLTWTLGTISYYMIPTMGPAFWYPWLYTGLDVTGVTTLQDSLWYGRQDVRFPLNPFSDSIQSVAGFASLHVALTLVIAMVAHYTVRHAVIRWAAWVFFVLTVISTLYFGWHYVADDIAGVVIAFLAVWLGGIATGQKFDRRGWASHPTTDSAVVPVSFESERDERTDVVQTGGNVPDSDAEEPDQVGLSRQA
jgi:membrane-associated phospholipid phosphatase